MPQSPDDPPADFTCALCGHQTAHLERDVHGWVCVDYLSCVARGIDTAVALGRRQRQLRLFEGGTDA